MSTRQELLQKWAPILEHDSMPKITDQYRKEITAQLLENQEIAMAESNSGMLFETAPANATGTGLSMGNAGPALGNIAGYDPILISLVRRAMPKLIAYDICGVQPMTQPTGLIFAMKSRYTSIAGAEALGINETNSGFSGDQSASSNITTDIFGTPVTSGNASPTATAEGNAAWAEMAFTIEKTSVVAQTRALKAEYSDELAQDLKAVHGLDAAAELSNILTQEILVEINREIVRTVYNAAVVGAQVGTATQGTFDLDVDSNGRWSVEKFKGLMFQMEREANAVGQSTRRGRANFIITSADVASSLAMAGVLDYAPALASNANLVVDDTSTTFAGILNGRFKVYIDPYAANSSNTQFFVAGYKGTSAFDAGIFYCPYVPLQMVRAQDPNTFQPKIGFKTRYGITANPFANVSGNVGDSALATSSNVYYRKCRVANLM
jgi:hypothetical protein